MLNKKISIQILCGLFAMCAHLSASSDSRIVTIGGAVTEMVFALGQGDSVVGVDLSSQYPAAATKLPQVGYIRAISSEGVRALNPTHVITSSEIQPRNALEQIKASGVQVTVVEAPESIAGVNRLLVELGIVLDCETAADGLIAKLNHDLAKLAKLAQAPEVVFFMSNPGSGQLRAAGLQTKADAFITAAGGRNKVQSHSGYKHISSEALAVWQPDVILIGVAEGMPNNDVDTVNSILENPAWQNVPAVQQGAVFVLPLGKSLNFGPRVGEALLEANQYFTNER